MKPARPFHQAAYHYAAEWIGTRANLSIDGRRIACAISVAIRAEPLAHEAVGEVVGYELTLFHAGGDWQQFLFGRAGNVLSEVLGCAGAPPKISIGKEKL